jgi:hypothetical protein
MYKQLKSKITGELSPIVQRLSDNAFIPFDPANTDYQEYLKWLAESPDNIPLPADGDSNGI